MLLPLANHLYGSIDSSVQHANHFTSFSNKIFSIYFEHNRNSTQSLVHELKNIRNFSPLGHGPKSDRSASAFLKLCFHLC